MIDRTLLLVILVVLIGVATGFVSAQSPATSANEGKTIQEESTQSAIFAGGCFWCIEADFEKLNGVVDVTSGYTGGSAETASYKTVSNTETGHFEAVNVQFDPEQISYAELVEYFWRHIDPTDDRGQFCDKGSSYKSAIFVNSEQQRMVAQASLEALEANKPFAEDIVTPILTAKPYYLAEDYHQDYYKKNPWRYQYYRRGCGRDQRVQQLWGKQ